MAVGSTVELAPTHYQIQGLPVLQAVAEVTGDATGGNATLTIGWDRTLTSLYLPIDFNLRGAASSSIVVSMLGFWEEVRGSSWRSRAQRIVMDAGGYITIEQAADWIKAYPWLPYHRGNGAANHPAVQAVIGNTDTIQYEMGITAIRVPEELFRAPQDFPRLAGGLLLR